MELFDLINDLPTIYQIVTGPRTENKEQHKKRHSNASSKVNKSAPEASNPSKVSRAASPTQKKEEDVEDMDIGEGAGDLCGICGRGENSNEEFWIGCDECSRWFHVQCVRYKCHKCSNKQLARRSTVK
jgi:PHD-finger